MNLGFIPARGGSKGIYKKNLIDINGKPLIAWTIEQALASSYIDRLIVSTDCAEIAAVAENYGAEIPFLRPAELSTDEASTEAAMLHACDTLNLCENGFENITLLQCTSPVRFPRSIDNAYQKFSKNGYCSLLSVVETHKFSWFNLKEPVAGYDFRHRPRRQDIPDSEITYIETGSIYITNLKKFMKYQNRLCGKIGMYETHYWENFEIDDLRDVVICEALIRELNK